MTSEKLDYKKRDKDFYQPGTKPSIIQVPVMDFIMVNGKGNPNTEGGEYQQAVELLYALSYTIKMGYKNNDKPDDYFDYTVPPLEGLWWMEDGTVGGSGSDYMQKDRYFWVSMIRQPEFLTREVFERACKEVTRKKPGLDAARARLETFEEGLCVQVMHIGPYDEEPKTITEMESFIKANGYQSAIGDTGADGVVKRHHEIYLGDPRRTEPSKLKTVLRCPVKKA